MTNTITEVFWNQVRSPEASTSDVRSRVLRVGWCTQENFVVYSRIPHTSTFTLHKVILNYDVEVEFSGNSFERSFKAGFTHKTKIS